jgi:hypothetical protein
MTLNRSSTKLCSPRLGLAATRRISRPRAVQQLYTTDLEVAKGVMKEDSVDDR